MIYSLILSSYGFHNVQCISMFWKWWIQSYFASKVWRISYWTSVGWSKSLGLVTSLLPKDWGILRKHKKKSCSKNMLRSSAFCLPFCVLWSWHEVQRRKIFSPVVIYAEMTIMPESGPTTDVTVGFFSFFLFFSPSDLSMLNSVQMHKLVISVSKSLFDFVLFLL